MEAKLVVGTYVIELEDAGMSAWAAQYRSVLVSKNMWPPNHQRDIESEV